MKQLKPLTDYTFKMKVIKDLGMRKPTENYYKKVRMATFECTNCRSHFDAVVSLKAQNQLFCTSCNGVSNTKPNRDHKLYRIWADTKAKLTATNSHKIPYLSKGINICDEWKNSFDVFFTWAISAGFQPGLTLDRKDNDGDYTPDNCRWVDMSVQICNQRPIKKNNTTGYKGISKISDTKWVANIRFRDKRFGLGSFNTPIEAAKAYDTFVHLMGWPHSTNGLLDTSNLVYPTNTTTINFLLKQGIQCSNTLSKEP